MRIAVVVSILVASILGTLWLTDLEPFFHLVPPALHLEALKMQDDKLLPSSLAKSALAKILHDASPIFGAYENVQSDLSTWMSHYPDATNLVHMNIPGVHDAATWNYSAATQRSLKHITDLVSDVDIDPTWFRCQDRSIIDMLNAGIRVLDLRYGQDVTKSTLVFWHGPALQSQTATLEDVMFAFYHWLDTHPTEVILLSFQYEANEVMNNIETESVQREMYRILTSPAAQSHVVQSRDSLGTLGAARGKAIILKRFDLDLLSPRHQETMPGLDFSPRKWTDNSANIELTYYRHSDSDDHEEGVAYIEDYYQPHTPASSTLFQNIDVKFDAIKTHLLKAASDTHPDGLYWAFTSGTKVRNEHEAVTPRKMALGREQAGPELPEHGVNERLRLLLGGMKGKRLGIVMLDFFEQPAELVQQILGLRGP